MAKILGRKGVAMNATYLIVLLVASLAFYIYIAPQISSAKTDKVVKSMDVLELTVLSKETCVKLDNDGDDREAGKTDVYAIDDVDIKGTQAYALYFTPNLLGEPFFGSWNLESWKVTCDGKDEGGNPKSYTLVGWNYADIYSEGYLHIGYDGLRTKALIDATKPDPLYSASWGCTDPGPVKVTLVTSSKGWWGGTDQNVELCYYSKKAK